MKIVLKSSWLLKTCSGKILKKSYRLIYRKAEEQVFETAMRLHDAENGLNNIEEENSFLRKRCQEYEEYFVKNRIEFEELLNKYNEAISSKKIEGFKNQEKHLEKENAELAIISEKERNSTEFTVLKVQEGIFLKLQLL